MSVEFTFNPISKEYVEELESSSNIFNMTKQDIEKEKVVLASFEDEKLGSAVEKLDLAVYLDGVWCLLDIDDKIEGYNEIPIGYLVKDVSYDRIMVILRRMSTMVLDKVKEGISTYIYSKVPDKYQDVQNDKRFMGFLAKNHIYLDGSDDMYEKVNNLKNDREATIDWLKSRD